MTALYKTIVIPERLRHPAQTNPESGQYSGFVAANDMSRIYFGCPVEPFSLPTPVSDDVGAARVSGAGLAGW